jgi:hypothetical protein
LGQFELKVLGECQHVVPIDSLEIRAVGCGDGFRAARLEQEAP